MVKNIFTKTIAFSFFTLISAHSFTEEIPENLKSKSESDLAFITEQDENLDTITTDEEENFEMAIKRLSEKDKEMFSNQSMSNQDLEIQRALIERIENIYFSQENLSNDDQKDLFNHYTNFISQGFNQAADTIWDFSKKDNNFSIDINAYNKNGLTPLMSASISNLDGGNVDYAIKLIKEGAEPNQVTIKNNINTLSLAATADNHKVVSVLLVAGANPFLENDFGLTAYDHAIKHESVRTSFILLNYYMSIQEVDEDFILESIQKIQEIQ